MIASMDEAAEKIADTILANGVHGIHNISEYAKNIGWAFDESPIDGPSVVAMGTFQVTLKLNSPGVMAEKASVILEMRGIKSERNKHWITIRK